MKIRTANDFFDCLDRESSWRKQELTNLYFSLTAERSGYRDLSVRSSIALAYAHWEGFVKNTSEYLLIYLSSKKLKGRETNKLLQRTFLLSKVGAYREIRNVESLGEFLEYFENHLPEATLFWDCKKIISTRSNLSFSVFEDILSKIGIDKSRYSTKQQKVDSLLSLRNSVAHGERPVISTDEAVEYVKIIRELIDAYKTDLLNFVVEERYKFRV